MRGEFNLANIFRITHGRGGRHAKPGVGTVENRELPIISRPCRFIPISSLFTATAHRGGVFGPYYFAWPGTTDDYYYNTVRSSLNLQVSGIADFRRGDTFEDRGRRSTI